MNEVIAGALVVSMAGNVLLWMLPHLPKSPEERRIEALKKAEVHQAQWDRDHRLYHEIHTNIAIGDTKFCLRCRKEKEGTDGD